MARVIVIGDGPAGMSAALFLAKNGQDVTVLGQDETAMHYAHLYNYLGIPEIGGSEFQEGARRQVKGFGADLRAAEVIGIDADADGLLVTVAEDEEFTADYVVAAGGRASVRLVQAAGAEVSDGAVVVDADRRTSVDRLYAAGRSVRPHRSQAIISAGAGASAALDILSRETGRDVTDWDTPPDGD